MRGSVSYAVFKYRFPWRRYSRGWFRGAQLIGLINDRSCQRPQAIIRVSCSFLLLALLPPTSPNLNKTDQTFRNDLSSLSPSLPPSLFVAIKLREQFQVTKRRRVSERKNETADSRLSIILRSCTITSRKKRVFAEGSLFIGTISFGQAHRAVSIHLVFHPYFQFIR